MARDERQRERARIENEISIGFFTDFIFSVRSPRRAFVPSASSCRAVVDNAISILSMVLYMSRLFVYTVCWSIKPFRGSRHSDFRSAPPPFRLPSRASTPRVERSVVLLSLAAGELGVGFRGVASRGRSTHWRGPGVAPLGHGARGSWVSLSSRLSSALPRQSPNLSARISRAPNPQDSSSVRPMRNGA